MKDFFMFLGFVIALNSYADIEYVPTERKVTSAAMVESNRGCFKELNAQGCGDPGEDIQHFRSCMNNAYDGLSDTCQKMMTKLYGKR